MITCTHCSISPVFLFKYTQENDNFIFLCGDCLAKIAETSEVADYSSLTNFPKTIKDLIELPKNELMLLLNSKKALESVSLSKTPQIIKDRKETLFDYISKLHGQAEILLDQTSELMHLFLSNCNEDLPELAAKSLKSFSKLEAKLLSIQNLINSQHFDNDSLLKHYKELDSQAHLKVINQGVNAIEFQKCEKQMDYKYFANIVKDQTEQFSSSISALKRFILSLKKNKENAESTSIVSCPKKKQLSIVFSLNQTYLQALTSESKLKLLIYFTKTNSIKFLNIQQKNIKAMINQAEINDQIQSALPENFSYINYGTGAFICGGMIKKKKCASRDCYILYSENEDLSRLVLKSYPRLIDPHINHKVVHIYSMLLGKKINIIMCLSGSNTKKCEYTVINSFESNTEESQWKELPSLNLVRINASTMIVNGYVYIYGGYVVNQNSVKNYHNSFESLPLESLRDIQSSKWNLVELEMPSLLNKSSFSYIELTSDSNPIVYIIGGNDINCSGIYFKTEIFPDKAWKIKDMSKFLNKSFFVNQDFKLGIDNKYYAYESEGSLYCYDTFKFSLYQE